jgi:hypothetical protein
MDDIELLGEFDIYAHIPEEVNGIPVRLLTSSYAREEFLKVDPVVFKAKAQTVAIPPPACGLPPGLQPPNEPHEPEDREEIVCSYPDCGYATASAPAMSLHKFRAHGEVSVARECTLTNQCPMCMQVFATTAIAKLHAQRSYARGGVCRARGSAFRFDVSQPHEWKCYLCDIEFEGSEHHRLHVLTWHLRRAPPANAPVPDIEL